MDLFVSTDLDETLQTWAVDRPPVLTVFGQGFVPQSNATPGVAGNAEQRQPGSAPELAGISHWINGNPIALADLGGKVMLVNFWIYNYISCMHTQPYLNA